MKQTPDATTQVQMLGVVVVIAAGSSHGMAIDEAGSLFTWGCGRNGQVTCFIRPDISHPHLSVSFCSFLLFSALFCSFYSFLLFPALFCSFCSFLSFCSFCSFFSAFSALFVSLCSFCFLLLLFCSFSALSALFLPLTALSAFISALSVLLLSALSSLRSVLSALCPLSVLSSLFLLSVLSALCPHSPPLYSSSGTGPPSNVWRRPHACDAMMVCDSWPLPGAVGWAVTTPSLCPVRAHSSAGARTVLDSWARAPCRLKRPLPTHHLAHTQRPLLALNRCLE